MFVCTECKQATAYFVSGEIKELKKMEKMGRETTCVSNQFFLIKTGLLKKNSNQFFFHSQWNHRYPKCSICSCSILYNKSQCRGRTAVCARVWRGQS